MKDMKLAMRKKLLFLFVGLVILAGMFIYINRYLYKNFAATDTVTLNFTPAQQDAEVGEEVNMGIILSGSNISSTDLSISYDPTKLGYPAETDGQTGFSQVGDYFEDPIIERVTTVDANTNVIRLVLISQKTSQQTSFQVNLKFTTRAPGTANVTMTDQTKVAGIDSTNAAVYFVTDMNDNPGQINIAGGNVSITPPVALGPIAYWKLDDGTGITAVDSVGNHDGELSTPPPTWVTDSADCKRGSGCLNFSNEADYVSVYEIDGLNFNQSNPFTITMWVKPTSLENSIILNKQNNTTNEFSYSITLTDGKYKFDLSKQNVSPSTISSNADVVLNQWTHIAAVSDGSKTIMYINGVEQTDTKPIAFTNATQSIARLYLGRGYNSALNFGGVMDDVKIYNYARTPSQIENDMNGTTTITPSPSGTVTNVIPDGDTGTVTLNLAVKLQGVTDEPDEDIEGIPFEVTIKDYNNQYTFKKKAQLTVNESGIWKGPVTFENVPLAPTYAVIIKGPKHISKKFCENEAREVAPGSYQCDEDKGNFITLKSGSNTLDFTNVVLLAGDLPIQNGLIDSVDLAFIRQNFGSSDENILARGDLNYDGRVDTQDFSLILAALGFKYDEE